MIIDDRTALWDALMKLPDDGHAMARGVVLANGEHALAYFSCRAGDDELLLNLAVPRPDDIADVTTYTTHSGVARWQVYLDGRVQNCTSEWPDREAFPMRLHGAGDRAEPNERDAEDCEACTAASVGLCDFHRGVEHGVGWLAQMTSRIASEPELAAQLHGGAS